MLLGNGVKRPNNGDVEKLVESLTEEEAVEVLNDPVVAGIIKKRCKS